MTSVRAPKIRAPLLTNIRDLFALVDIDAGTVSELKTLLADAPVRADGVLALGVHAADVGAAHVALIDVLALASCAGRLETHPALTPGHHIKRR